MKYLTKEWATVCFTDEQYEAIWAAYLKAYRKARKSLPAKIAKLTKVHWHDAVVKAALYSRANKKLSLTCITGDLQVGYKRTTIDYRGATISRASLKKLRGGRARVEILYDEIYKVEGRRFSQQFLIRPYDEEIELTFKTVEIKEQNAEPKDREAKFL